MSTEENGKTTEYAGRNAAVIMASFVITVLLAFALFAKMRIYPGGKFTLLTYDLAQQYLPYISSLRYVGNSDCSFMFSMFGGLGVSYIANIAYYMANPLMFITVFVPLEYMPEAIYVITLLKLGLCSVTFCIYILYGLRLTGHRMMVILLSVAYALSAYNLFYSMCLMWLDGVILLPLILLGVERMLRGKRSGVYVLTLTASLYMSYYITYMSGLFTGMYFLFRLIYFKGDAKKNIRHICSFAISSAVSIGMAMPIILPAVKYTALGKLNEIVKDDRHLIRVTPLRILRNLFPAGEYFMLNEGAPQLYCGIFALVLVVVFFVTKRIALREKTAATVIMLVYFASFMLVPLDKIWHGFRNPVCFPARYAFTCVCFLLVLAIRALQAGALSGYEDRLGTRSVAVRAFLFAYCILELLFNGSTALASVNGNSHYEQNDRYKRRVAQICRSLDGLDDDDLYRIVSGYPITQDDGFLFGYNDVGYFSSAYNASLNSYLKSKGIQNDRHVLESTGITPVTGGLLGVRYYMGIEKEFFGTEYVTGRNPYGIYRDPLALPIGYMVDGSAREPDITENPFRNHENLISGMLGRDVSLYSGNGYEIGDIEDGSFARKSLIEAEVKNDGPVWLYFPLGTDEEREKYDIDTEITVYNYKDRKEARCECTVDGADTYYILGSNGSRCVYIGEYSRGDRLSIETYSTTYYHDPIITTLDADEYERVMKELAENVLSVSSHRNGVIEGTVNGVIGKQLAVSLPYMEGYRVYIDNKSADYGYYNPAMISILIPEGEHIVRIEYTSPGLYEGIVAGIVSFVIYILSVGLSELIAAKKHGN